MFRISTTHKLASTSTTLSKTPAPKKSLSSATSSHAGDKKPPVAGTMIRQSLAGRYDFY